MKILVICGKRIGTKEAMQAKFANGINLLCYDDFNNQKSFDVALQDLKQQEPYDLVIFRGHGGAYKRNLKDEKHLIKFEGSKNAESLIESVKANRYIFAACKIGGALISSRKAMVNKGILSVILLGGSSRETYSTNNDDLIFLAINLNLKPQKNPKAEAEEESASSNPNQITSIDQTEAMLIANSIRQGNTVIISKRLENGDVYSCKYKLRASLISKLVDKFIEIHYQGEESQTKTPKDKDKEFKDSFLQLITEEPFTKVIGTSKKTEPSNTETKEESNSKEENPKEKSSHSLKTIYLTSENEETTTEEQKAKEQELKEASTTFQQIDEYLLAEIEKALTTEETKQEEEKTKDKALEFFQKMFLKYAEKGKVNVIKALLTLKSHSNFKINYQDGYGWTALMFAARNGNIEVIQDLLKEGADFNIKTKGGRTALMFAAKNGRTKTVQDLLKNNAISVNAKTKGGRTALMFAAAKGHTAVAQYLLGEGADVNAKTKNGRTALIFATENENTKVAQAFLENDKININAKNIDGWTALMFAAFKGSVEIVQTLLLAGADVSHKTVYAKTALDIAQYSLDKEKDTNKKNSLITIIKTLTAYETLVTKCKSKSLGAEKYLSSLLQKINNNPTDQESSQVELLKNFLKHFAKIIDEGCKSNDIQVVNNVIHQYMLKLGRANPEENKKGTMRKTLALAILNDGWKKIFEQNINPEIGNVGEKKHDKDESEMSPPTFDEVDESSSHDKQTFIAVSQEIFNLIAQYAHNRLETLPNQEQQEVVDNQTPSSRPAPSGSEGDWFSNVPPRHS